MNGNPPLLQKQASRACAKFESELDEMTRDQRIEEQQAQMQQARQQVRAN